MNNSPSSRSRRKFGRGAILDMVIGSAFVRSYRSHRIRRAALTICILSFSVVGPMVSTQASSVSVERVDGRCIPGEWVHWSAEGLCVRVNGVETTIPIVDVVAIVFDTAAGSDAARTDGMVRLIFAEGGATFGRLLSAAPGLVGFQRSDGISFMIPFDRLAGIQFQQRRDCPGGDDVFRDALRAPDAGRDVLIACDAGEVKSVGGAVESIGPESGTIRYEGRVRTFSIRRIFGVVFARSGVAGPAVPALVTLRDGSMLPAWIEGAPTGASKTEHGAGGWQLRLPFDASLTVPAEQVVAIRWHNDRVVPLSGLTPTREHIEGMVHRPWPWRRDRSVTNMPIRLAGREYASGLGVHAQTELTYPVEGEYELFYAVVGVDDHARPRGSVVFKVIADGAVVFDSGLLTGRDAPREVRVPLKGVRELVLRVEDGGDLDLSDEANWADARLVRPATAPP